MSSSSSSDDSSDSDSSLDRDVDSNDQELGDDDNSLSSDSDKDTSDDDDDDDDGGDDDSQSHSNAKQLLSSLKPIGGYKSIVSRVLGTSITGDKPSMPNRVPILAKRQHSGIAIAQEKLKLKQEREAKRLKKLLADKEHIRINATLGDPTSTDRELTLLRLTCRGVVKFFNAIAEHQKAVAGDMDTIKNKKQKKEKQVPKTTETGTFLNMLKDTKSKNMNALIENKVNNNSNNNTTNKIPEVKNIEYEMEYENENENKSWGVFRDDYLTGATRHKDWDLKQDSDDDNNNDDDDGSSDE